MNVTNSAVIVRLLCGNSAVRVGKVKDDFIRFTCGYEKKIVISQSN